MVDRGVTATEGDVVVVARVGDELCVKRLSTEGGHVRLHPENEAYQPIEVPEGADFEVWGRVMYSILRH